MGRPGRISRLRICGDGRKIRHLVRFYVASDEAPVSCYLCVWVIHTTCTAQESKMNTVACLVYTPVVSQQTAHQKVLHIITFT